ncbi:MAG TPA: CheR family methyltransferase [Verrucomicrobiae bacterium]|nr:CheR family methyltransferase [Verrucomicrobiae bacterium]
MDMMELSHIYFAGEDRPEEAGPGARPRTRLAAPRIRLPSHAAPKAKRGPAITEALSPFLRFVLQQSGLGAGCYQPKALNRRVGACLRVLRAPNEAAGLLMLKQNPELLRASLSALLIGVSGFFRDSDVFEHLREVLVADALRLSGAMRVYSAGCSAGQELYSVAILLDELGRLKRSRLLGVDCRSDAIEQAKSGSFAVSELDDIELQRKQHYFRIGGHRAFILPSLRERIEWRVADLGLHNPDESWDLVLFRNVAIYLEAEDANSVWQQLDKQLKPGGLLVTGKAERPPEALHWKRESACIYRKQPV